MKILLVHNYLSDRGGEDRCFDLLVNLLQKKGHTTYKFIKDSKVIETGFTTRVKTAIGMFNSKLIKKELSDVIYEFKPKIVHISNIFPLISQAVYTLCRRSNLPIVQSIHNYRYLCPKATLYRNGSTCELCVKKNFFYPAIKYGCYHNSHLASLIFSTSYVYHQTKNLLNLVDKFIFPAMFARNYYVKYLNIPINKTKVIPNFVEDITCDNKSTKKGNYFLYVGRLSEEKGILNLLEIFSRLPELRLIIIGDGSLKEKVKNYTKFKNISYLGYLSREKLYSYMKRALFTIIPSAPLYDFGPLVLMESYANGTPVIAPRSGVFVERIIDGKTGIFYDSNDFEDLGSKLLYYQKNKQELLKMGFFARKEYENKYLSDIYYQALIKTYKEVL